MRTLPQELDLTDLTQEITLTEFDHKRLTGLVALYRARSGVDTWGLHTLEHQLRRAQVVKSTEVASDLVTMNSWVTLQDLKTGERVELTLVFPEARAAPATTVAVLSPLGLSLLGRRVGQTLTSDTFGGKRHLRIESIAYQPEASGNFQL